MFPRFRGEGEASMQIGFGEIGREKTCYSVEERSWLPHDEVDISTVQIAEVAVRAKNEDTVILTGRLAACVNLECSRCNQPVEHCFDEEFYYLVTLREEDCSGQVEKECSDEECDTLYLHEPVVDVDEILREQMLLAVPGKVVCDEACRGVCPGCGGLLSRGECSCSESLPDSPFAVLEKLKKD